LAAPDPTPELARTIDEIAGLAQADSTECAFYTAVLARLAPATGAVAATYWRLQARRWIAEYSSGATELDAVAAQHLGSVSQPSTRPVSIDGGELLIVAAPIDDAAAERALSVILPAKRSPEQEQGAVRFLAIVADLAAAFHRQQRLRELERFQQQAALYDRFAQLVHSELRLGPTVYAIVNDGRRIVDAERLTVLVRRGAKWSVAAVSGQAVVQRASTTVRLLEQLARPALVAGEAIELPGDGSSPQTDAAWQSYVDESSARTLRIQPLFAAPQSSLSNDDSQPQPELVGGLVAEWFKSAPPAPSSASSLAAIANHAGPALANALSYERIPLASIWSSGGFPTSRLLKLLAAVAIVIVIGAAMLLVETDFTLTAEGQLQPQARRHVFAHADGVVTELLVADGDRVEAGGVLLTLQDEQLDYRIQEINGQLLTNAKKLESVKAMRVATSGDSAATAALKDQYAADEQELNAAIAGLREQLKLLQRRRERLAIRSPIKGEAITLELRERLNSRPVQRGQLLMTIARLDGPWVLKLTLPDQRAGHLYEAFGDSSELTVDFVVLTDPDVRQTGTLKTIARSTRVDPRLGHGVPLVVEIDKTALPTLQPGATVIARIHCGRRSVGYVWLREAIEFVQSRVLFRF
jgi:multidrug efflux pump subunit AcrA (membrane-fusion protein)